MAQMTDLPPEVLAMIFRRLHDDRRLPSWELIQDQQAHYIARMLKGRLLKLQLVNKTWRSVVRDTRFVAIKRTFRKITYGVGERGFWYKVHKRNSSRYARYLLIFTTQL